MAWMKPRKYKMGDKRRTLEREPRTERKREGGLAVVVVNRGLGDKSTGVHFFTKKKLGSTCISKAIREKEMIMLGQVHRSILNTAHILA